MTTTSLLQDKTVYNLPAGAPFARTVCDFLYEHIWQEYDISSLERADTLILLPTRRAKRILQNALLERAQQNGDAQALILPRIQAIGDVDEDDFGLAQTLNTDNLQIPPALSRMHRKTLLARLITEKMDGHYAYDRALDLADALGQFLDQVYTENLTWDALENIVPEDFADHWQITLDFLKILTVEWDNHLKTIGKIDYAARRNRLILGLNDAWLAAPPTYPIIAAGSTGSIPAVARVLDTIAALPNGHVILPALDTYMDAADWDCITPVHPQYGLKTLLEKMDILREHVQVLTPDDNPRKALCAEIMRPADTTEKWLLLDKTIIKTAALRGVQIMACRTPKHEADAIAFALRDVLETPNKTAVLITPDRDLATRVRAACMRWGIIIDDSAGMSLAKTNIGIFLNGILTTLNADFAPVSLLSLLKNPLCATFEESAITLLDRALRGITPPKGIDGLRFAVNRHFKALEKRGHHTPNDHEVCLNTIDRIQDIFAPLIFSNARPPVDTLKAHLHTVFTLIGSDSLALNAPTHDALKDVINELESCAPDIAALTCDEYAALFNAFITEKPVRAPAPYRPRVQILGQLEARLIDADLVIMGGLNEGIWPPAPAHDPWMSRAMRDNFGLPAHETSIGLAAHDFIQGLSANNVLITRSKTHDGAPSVPARWLLRLETVLDACGYDHDEGDDAPNIYAGQAYAHWAGAIDRADDFTPCKRPAPTPAAADRPRQLSATAIDMWLKDPYALYARYVLKLDSPDPLESKSDAALKGTILHDTLERFTKSLPKDIPQNAPALIQTHLSDTMSEHIGDMAKNTAEWSFWTNRMHKILDNYIIFEQNHRANARNLKNEVFGRVTWNIDGAPFTLHARADRIDLHDSGAGHIIIDYKSAGTYTISGFGNGKQTQMPVEALILIGGGFAGIPEGARIHDLHYWTLNDTQNGVSVTAAGDKTHDAIDKTKDNIVALIRAFDNKDTPYYSAPNPSNILRFNDFEHLSRIREWGIINADDQTDSGASGGQS